MDLIPEFWRPMPGNKRRPTGIISIIFSICLAVGIADGISMNRQFSGAVGHATAILDHIDAPAFGLSNASIEYHYLVQGRAYSRHAHIGRATEVDLRSKSTVPVKYLLNHPSISRIDLPTEERRRGNIYPSVVMAVFFFAVGWRQLRKVEKGVD